MTERILTVGHSTHPFDEFVELLRGADAGAVVDVRRLPGSNRFPQFDRDALEAALPAHGISYRRIAELGGRRSAQREVPEAVNALWRNRSFHNYADYALTEPFDIGLAELLALAQDEQAAVMCSEAVWWRCHRRIIADHLLARGEVVAHLMPDGRLSPAELMPGAVVAGDSVTYPATECRRELESEPEPGEEGGRR
ncbi:DUF488 domain-containing protein [Leucobacter sp. CSA1]|uniref:DUF488 domain-containing protein n=1 Tax=Leucobacter chromiisoli TaxID=2796471 RepID=A0A934UW29_9MICO|nr:DUF488 domain-containing protein [Leucobacter chromiisoli]MBK0419838.1 DUF488 domain-containing protein [Leucobacter chromiisoli]